MSMHAVDR